MSKPAPKLLLVIMMAILLAGCGYTTPQGGGFTPYVIVVTPTVTVAPPTTATTVPPTAKPTAPTGTLASATTPAKTVLPTLVVNPDNTYTVKSGDTLLGIAIRLNVDVDDLVNINNLKDANALQIGQILKLPSRKTPDPAKTP